jgi:hypothetical protein
MGTLPAENQNRRFLFKCPPWSIKAVLLHERHRKIRDAVRFDSGRGLLSPGQRFNAF